LIFNLPLKILENYRVNVKYSSNSNPSNLFGFRLFMVLTSDCGVAFVLNIRQEFRAKVTKVVWRKRVHFRWVDRTITRDTTNMFIAHCMSLVKYQFAVTHTIRQT